MSGLRAIATAGWAGQTDSSHITDLIIAGSGADRYLIATTRYDGDIASFSFDTRGLTLEQVRNHTRSDAVGSPGSLGAVTIDGRSGVITGGGSLGALQFLPILSDGTFGSATTLGTIPDIPADLVQLCTVVLPSGRTAIYGGIQADDGLGRIVLTSAGSLFASGWTRDYADTYADGVGAITSATVDGTTYIFTAGINDPGITTWAMDWRGFLSNAHGLSTDDGLWISAPTAMETVYSGGATYLVLAAAGSGSLSVMRVDAGGALTVVDHTIDDLSTRFGGVTSIATVTSNGQTWIAAGGADDGVSLFLMMPGGRLIHVAMIEDTTTTSLADISALAMSADENGLNIFAASATDFGITQLHFDPANTDVLTGSAANDRLSGGAGVDVLIDGAGRDTLTGGTGADVFVLTADDTVDYITDFTLGTDRIDLGDWPQLRSLAQLDITYTATGFVITYGDERLVVTTSGPFDRTRMTAADIIGTTHLPRDPVVGYGEPYDPDAELPPLISTQPRPTPVTPTYPTDDPTEVPGSTDSNSGSGNGGGQTIGPTSGNDRLVGTSRADRIAGLGGNDRIIGLAGNDRLSGGSGNDVLIGGTGDDRLIGGTGHDVLSGKSGADRLFGKSGNDILKGGAGTDLLVGSRGNDVLRGQAGRDTLKGGSGADRLIGGGGNDRMAGGSGSDRMAGGSGNDRLTGQAGNDRLIGGAGRDILNGGSGRDYIDGGKGHDRMTGGAGADRFVFNGGVDVITDWTNRDRLLLNDRLWRGDLTSHEILENYAATTDDGVYLSFGRGNRLLIEDVAHVDVLLDRIVLI